MSEGFDLQAKVTKEALFAVIEMLEKKREHIRIRHKQIYSEDLVEALFSSPIIAPVNLGKELDVNYRTASRYLAELAKGKVVQERFVGKYHLFINKLLHPSRQQNSELMR
jgi:Fic family protein